MLSQTVDIARRAARRAARLFYGSPPAKSGEPPADPIRVAADHWSKLYGNEKFYRTEWQCHPFALEMRRTIYGGQERADWFVDTRMTRKPVERALGVGAGIAIDELHLVYRGAARHYDLMDISDAGLKILRENAAKHGYRDRVSCIVADANEADLGHERYGLITFMSSLHHIDKLERVLTACERALEPGGILWACEYIGPDCYQCPPAHIEIANRFFRTLHPSVRNRAHKRIRIPTREQCLAADPTESLHSSEIERVMRGIWPDLEFIGLYGSLAFMVSWSLNHDAIYDTAIGRSEMKRLLEEDRRLIDAGHLPHYYANLIARKKNG
jgi:ubiquinone/menaquinone biosynthesis C-methylase UbiE